MLGKANQIKTLRVLEGNNGFEYTLNYMLEGLGEVEILQIQTFLYEDSCAPGYQFMQALIIYKEV